MDEELGRELARYTATRASKYDPSSLIWKEKVEVSVFFWKDYSIRDETLLLHSQETRPVIIQSLPAKANSKLRIVKNVKDESLMRCMLIPIVPQESVCRECLAMHSTTFTVRMFRLYHGTKKTADVGVFLSNHLSLDIVSNCNKTFCPIIIRLNSIDCGRIHSIFSVNDQAVGDVNRMKLEEVQQVLLTIAHKRMASRHFSSPLLTETFEPERSLNVLRPEEHDCIEVRVASHLRRYCLKCILKEVKGYRLVVISSLYISLIFTKSSQTILKCKECKVIHVRHPEDCGQNGEHYFNSLKPSHLDMPNKLYESCLAVYHGKFDGRCRLCIGSNLGIKKGDELISRSPLLFHTYMAASKMTLKAISELSHKCLLERKCSRIQAVPLKFCSIHRAFTVTQSRRRNKVIAFNQNLNSVGVWPPLQHQIEENMNGLKSPTSPLSPFAATDSPQIWPASNNIALVEIKFADSRSYDCLKCLAEHTELFFFYRSEVERSGYVWMRPALSTILSFCVGMHCASLSYNENGMQMRRPVGLRPVTTIDIRLSLGSYMKRKTKAPKEHI